MTDNRSTVLAKLANDRVEYSVEHDWITQHYYSECFGNQKTSVQIPMGLAMALRQTLKQCIELNNGKLYQNLCADTFHSYFSIDTAIVKQI